MDERTVNHYNQKAEDTCRRYRQASTANLMSWVERNLDSSRSVLDIGCGSGRDLSLFASLGHAVEGVDASQGMINQALNHYPELKGKLHVDSLPHLSAIGSQSFDVVTALAVLMHVPSDEIASSLRRISSLVNPGGLLLVILPADRRTLPGKLRNKEGRLFSELSKEKICEKLKACDMTIKEQFTWPDSLNREGFRWDGLTFKKII